jgi:hypothetical protein
MGRLKSLTTLLKNLVTSRPTVSTQCSSRTNKNSPSNLKCREKTIVGLRLKSTLLLVAYLPSTFLPVMSRISKDRAPNANKTKATLILVKAPTINLKATVIKCIVSRRDKDKRNLKLIGFLLAQNKAITEIRVNSSTNKTPTLSSSRGKCNSNSSSNNTEATNTTPTPHHKSNSKLQTPH